MPSLNERMSEEELEDVHAFSNLKRNSLTDMPSNTSLQLSSLQEIDEDDEEEEQEEEEEEEQDEEQDPQDKLAARLFPQKNKNKRPNHLSQMKEQPDAPVSMPNIYGVRVSTGGSTSGSYAMVVSDDEDDLLTDHKGICDLEYSQVKKIVDDVLHHKPNDHSKSSSAEFKMDASNTANGGGGDADEVMAIPEEEEEELQAAEQEEQQEEAENNETNEEETTKPKKKGFFSRLKKRSTPFKKALGNP